MVVEIGIDQSHCHCWKILHAVHLYLLHPWSEINRTNNVPGMQTCTVKKTCMKSCCGNYKCGGGGRVGRGAGIGNLHVMRE